MIVVTSLLILVAVTLLVLGLTAGSSTMLIGSIVASLLAAVALVVGARQASTRRRATVAGGMPASPDEDPFLAEAEQPPAEFAMAGPRRAPAEGAGPAGTHTTQGARAAESARREPGPVDEFQPPPPAPTVAVDEFPPPPGRAADEQSYAREADDYAGPVGEPGSDFSGSDPILDRDGEMFRQPSPDPEAPDYDRASSVIGSARAEDADESWRRPGPQDGPLLIDDDEDPDDPRAARVPADEDFAEADEDDPEDEPLPQAVSPGDAVRVARMDNEVLVVDGRPRFHVADCHHLTGRLTEPIPAGEAIELGFTPCGLCRPVDRLIAQTARR